MYITHDKLLGNVIYAKVGSVIKGAVLSLVKFTTNNIYN